MTLCGLNDYLRMVGYDQRVDLILILYLLASVAVAGFPSAILLEMTGEKQQLYWQLIVRHGLLNQFIARLYNDSIANKIIPQDFSLKYEVGSMVWFLRNTLVPEN